MNKYARGCIAPCRVMLALVLAAAALNAMPTFAAQRVALVIGNGSYQHAARLPNPGSDARLLAETLRGLGFDVTERTDLGRNAMERTVLEFSRRAAGAEVALVFFAGHGIQMSGHNYLLPVDAKLEDDFSLRVEAVNLDLLLESVSGASTRLVVLDACRNNPFAARMRMSGTNRSVARGLGRVEVAEGGTLIAFSTSPGDVAADGDGRNSPFSAALSQHLKQPGLEIRQVFTRVRSDVRSKTSNQQTPWENSSLLGDVYLAGSAPAPTGNQPDATAAAPFDPRTAELSYWQGVERLGTLEAYEGYRGRYPKGEYAELAMLQIARLTPSKSTSTPPVAPAAPASSKPALTGRRERVSYMVGADVGKGLAKVVALLDGGAVLTGIDDGFAGSPVLADSELSTIKADMQSHLQNSPGAGTVVNPPRWSPTTSRVSVGPGSAMPIRRGYMVGADVGKGLAQIAGELDMNIVKAGLVDALAGAARLTETELADIRSEFMAALQRKRESDEAVAAVENNRAGEAFLTGNKSRAGVRTTASGLQYEVLREGHGRRPSSTDTVRVHYRGTKIDGTLFDSSIDRGEPATFPLDGVIKGWTEALQLMPVGSQYKLYIPPDLAYGDNAPHTIGKNATLIFEVELLGIQ